MAVEFHQLPFDVQQPQVDAPAQNPQGRDRRGQDPRAGGATHGAVSASDARNSAWNVFAIP
jgi:hypothetical protein